MAGFPELGKQPKKNKSALCLNGNLHGDRRDDGFGNSLKMLRLSSKISILLSVIITSFYEFNFKLVIRFPYV